jgi:hypothetical protein
MVTLEMSENEAMLMAAVLDDSIIDSIVEIDILTQHYPELIDDIADVEHDLDVLYTLADAVDNALWEAEVDA